MFVSNRNLKDVYAIVEQGGKREVTKVLKGLNSPNGIAFHNGTLYVAERHRITAYDGIEDRLANPPEAKVVIDNLDPTQQPGHFWKFLAMGPDGKLYFNVGAPGNIVMPSYTQATINRVDPKTGVMEIYASGVRNSVGFDWDPRTKDLWFTNHARDWVSDDLPHDTLHRAAKKGMNFGYPYLPPGRLARPRVRQGPLVQRVRRAGRQARRAHRAERHALLHRQDVPGRVPQQHLHRHARLVEPHHQAGLQRHARDRRRAAARSSSSRSSRASSPTRRPTRRCGAGRTTCS